jgi:putative PIN family toxin of toxin-antitoxin system
LDPNVLISAAISAAGAPRALLVYWYLGRFQMLVSYDLLYELEAVLLRPKFRSKLTVSDVLTYVRWLREGAMFVHDAPPLEEWLLARLSDPDDAYLMALAREYRADYLVTGDRGLLGMSDLFASDTLDLPGLAVLTPRDFLQHIEQDED